MVVSLTYQQRSNNAALKFKKVSTMKFLAKRYPGSYEFESKHHEEAFFAAANSLITAERAYLDSAKEYMKQNPGKGLSDYRKDCEVERPKRSDFITETLISHATTSLDAEIVQIELI